MNVVVGCKPWNYAVFVEVINKYDGEWQYIGKLEYLTYERVCSLKPEYIFFLHWSWKVPSEIVNQFECVNFHMTDLPYGRGGSPLQNLIVRGHENTKLTALRMTDELDAGDVYLKADLFIGSGTAEEIYTRASYLAAEMIRRIVKGGIIPVPQEGESVVFKRRLSEESEIKGEISLVELYDFVRMLDAEGYPRAYLRMGRLFFEFSGANMYDRKITASVVIKEDET